MKVWVATAFGLSVLFHATVGFPLQRPQRLPRNVPRPSQDGIHHKITGRSLASVLQLFGHGAVQTEGGAVVDPLLRLLLAMDGAVAGTTNLLSLGEGRSSFVFQLLGERKYFLNQSQETADQIDNIHAVDVAYPVHDGRSIVDQRRPDPNPVAGLDRYDLKMVPVIQQYPLNYHSQLFQDLDIRDASGRRRQFSLIVSAFALTYVLLADAPPGDMCALVERVVAHLLPGGMLLMAPVPQSGAPADLEERVAKYNEVLDGLRRQGVISDYNRIEGDTREKRRPLLIIK